MLGLIYEQHLTDNNYCVIFIIDINKKVNKMKESETQLDPSKPLKHSQRERFAINLFNGMNTLDSYIAATNNFDKKKKNIEQTAYPWSKRPEVLARVEWLKHQAANEQVMSMVEKRKFLATVVRTSIGDVNVHSQVCREYNDTDDGLKVKSYNKLEAIKIDNDMAGDNAPLESSHRVIFPEGLDI
jgi:hypothetical protein